MYKKQPTLSSIPERNENEEEHMATKWVPKKKHDVLKAKYKCLKKLFQIYDASVIGILPETYGPETYLEEEIQTKKRRKKRSHRTKTDACAGTTEISSGDVTQQSVVDDTEKESIATAVIRDLKIKHQSCSSTAVENAATQDSRENFHNITIDQECECTQTSNEPHPIPYLMFNEKRKLTRFQSFIHRIFGIRHERGYKNYVLPNGHVYAASDNNISHYNSSEKRRRRGLRFRRMRRPKKIQSETALRDMKSPIILTYVQSIQRSCLMDTTPRQCPITGCLMLSYGIINYNDHLNLCHFKDRKYICHYCHEGFEREYDKLLHENEHIGITKLPPKATTPTSVKQFPQQKANDTQTDSNLMKCDFSEDKLKKIVSFFEKINDPDQILTEMKKSRFSMSNLQTETAGDGSDSNSDKRTVSLVNLNRKTDRAKYSSGESTVTSKGISVTPITCHLCGEQFDFRRQLSLHVDLEHRVHDKFSKFHSCAGILNSRPTNHVDMISEDGKINVQSVDRSHSGIRRINTSSTLTQESFSEISRRKSDESLSYDPSTNIVYYTSLESVKKPSVVNSIVKKVRTGINPYKWEPGTKIIRV
ncbi:unnamed protein product [Arctia plantaginis]|uniref:C2H2-type domain-containing protein n=1 Tax=Arctia plantaginis TaxID=874455 RepID=A0A8S1AB49_ARCPL|nr:unnamed protein product [Arctia plantaginis]